MPYDGTKYEPRDEIAKALHDAAQIIKQYGHYKGEFGGSDRGYCIHGAISRATQDSLKHRKVARRLAAWFERFEGRPVPMAKDCPSFVEWNDAPERTKEEVITVLESAAFYAEEKVDAA